VSLSDPLVIVQGPSPPVAPNLDGSNLKRTVKERKKQAHERLRLKWELDTMKKYSLLSRLDKQKFRGLAVTGES
jgi:hypothetical protein